MKTLKQTILMADTIVSLFTALSINGKKYFLAPGLLILPQVKKRVIVFFTTISIAALFSSQKLLAQTTSYWNVAGNNNATSSSKLGTTNSTGLGVYTNNIQRMTIDGNKGNVGIGIIAPLTKFHISDQTAISSFTGISNAGVRIQGLNSPRNFALLGFSGFSSTYTGNLAQIGANFTNSGSLLSFGTSNNYASGITNTAMTIDFNGNVGIGTTTPASRLHMIGATSTSGLLRLQSSSNYITFLNSAGAYTGDISGSGRDLNINSTTSNDLSTKPTGNLILQTGSNSSIAGTIYAGNVGIGTTTPAYKLSIKSSSLEANNNTSLLNLSGRNPVLAFADENNVGYGYLKSLTNAPNPGYNKGMEFGASPGYSIFFSTNYTPSMMIGNTGNVGIGTTQPSYKLSVNGTIQAKEIRVETGWADYVFEKDYALRSLDNVAKYIAQNKHLPGINSAKDIQQNGLAVADMQSKMMAKIEELTLYLIQQNLQIQKLKEKVEHMEKQ